MTRRRPSSPRAAALRSGEVPRVLLALWDGGGNAAPQRALVRELRRRHCDVHVIGHDSLAEGLTSDGATFHRLESAPPFDHAQPRTPAEEVASLQQDVLGSPRFASDVMRLYDEIGPHVLLIDCMLAATLKAAVDGGTRFCTVLHFAWMPAGNAVRIMDRVCRSLPGHTAPVGYNDLLAAADLVLATSYAEFATEVEVPSNVVFVGPIREPVETAAWPRRFPGRPLVLASLSSTYQQQEQTLRNVGEALSSLPVEALITTGRGMSPEVVAPADNLQVLSFVDHDAVLPLVDLVVTHAGLGTASFSAGAGVPVLCLPNGRDQNDDAARIEALGLGRTLPPDAAPDRIAATAAEMLADQALRATCEAFASRVDRFGDLSGAADLVLGQARGGPAAPAT